jgi:hypothetical protein
MPGFAWEPKEEEVKTVMTGFARNAVLVRSACFAGCVLLLRRMAAGMAVLTGVSSGP